MSNPHSPADSCADAPAVTVSDTQAAAAKPSRKGPRRATAPAGAPATSLSNVPALLVIGADGSMVSAAAPVQSTQESALAESPLSEPPLQESESPAPDGHSPDADPAALREPESSDDPASEIATVDSRPAETLAVKEASSAAEKVEEPASEDGAADAQAAVTPNTAASNDAGASAEPSEETATVPTDTAADEPGDDATQKPAVDALEPEAVADETETAATAQAEQPVAEAVVPLSRRERRLAEQGPMTGAPVASPAATAAAQALRAAPVAESGRIIAEPGAGQQHQEQPGKARGKRRGTFASFARGLFFLLVISLVVVGMGTVLTGHNEAAVGPSQTEANRQRAWEQTTLLLAQASHLGGSAGSAPVQDILSQTAADLAVQAAALGDGLPASTTTPAATPAPAPPTLAQFTAALHASGEALLSNAMTADYAMGRVFAAAGTSQLLRSQNLSTAVGSTPQPSQFLPARVDFPAAVGPTCKSTLEPRPGATIDAALRAGAMGEQKAVYAYQVATTRFAEPQFSSSAKLLAGHKRKLQVLNEELALRCLPLATPVAGFVLDSSFTSAPAKALADLEGELSAIYGDLAALSLAQNSSAVTLAAGAASAEDAPSTPSQEPSSTSNLREISVTWLLDSAQKQAFWGGTVGALPGLAVTPPPSATATP